jgi:hypothetical protein
MHDDDFFLIVIKLVAVFFFLLAIVYIPTCSWHAYQDDLTCKEKTGLYNCNLKAREHKQKIEFRNETSND